MSFKSELVDMLLIDSLAVVLSSAVANVTILYIYITIPYPSVDSNSLHNSAVQDFMSRYSESCSLKIKNTFSISTERSKKIVPTIRDK